MVFEIKGFNFLEFKLTGEWTDTILNYREFTKVATNNENCFLDIVEIDGVRRKFQFKKKGQVRIASNVVFFTDDAIEEELVIDEKEQFTGKENRPKL